MRRRAPKDDGISTLRRETDKVEIVSGLFHEKTAVTPLCGIIRNADAVSKDYQKNLLRPGHADFPAFVKYGGFHDYRGGGHFSGRLTAPLVFAGSIAKQLLSEHKIVVGGHIKQIGGIQDISFEEITEKLLLHLSAKDFPLIFDHMEKTMKEEIIRAKEKGDSVGGVIECAAVNLPAGLGSPFFSSMESEISSFMFSIPAVKGIEFGDGFALAQMYGSQANDALFIENGKIKALTNHSGGINGGLTNGMPLVFRVAVRPTPSVAVEQKTVDVSAMEDASLMIKGRHDPCIVPRAVCAVEAGLALCLLDRMCFDGLM